MKNFFILILIFLYNSTFTQEIAVNIPFWERARDSGRDIIIINENEFLISVTCDCENFIEIFSQCMGIIHLTQEGEVVNKFVFHNPYADTILFMRNGLKYLDGQVYTSGYVTQSDSSFFYLYSASIDGSNKIVKEIIHPTEKHLEAAGINYLPDHILINGYIKNSIGRRYFFHKYDYDFNLLEDIYLPYDTLELYNFNILPLETGDYISSAIKLKKFAQGGQKLFHIVERFDQKFNLLDQVLISEKVSSRHPTKIISDPDGNFYLTSISDVFFEEPSSYPYPSALYKLNSKFDILWEHIFLHKSQKYLADMFIYDDQGLVGAGSTSYFYLEEDSERIGADGWAFRMDFDGNIVWDKFFVNLDSTLATYPYSLIKSENNLYFIGVFNYLVENPDPFVNEIDTWLVSLDLNGCWNSNCEDIIIIEGDSTNAVRNVLQQDIILNIYPNPTTETLVIENLNLELISKDQYLHVTNIEGKVLLQKEFNSPKTILNFRGLAPGVYFVNIVSKGVVIRSEKVIIQN